MSDDRYIKLVELFQAEGYSYAEASKLAYEEFTEGSEPILSDEEEEQQALAEIENEKQKSEMEEVIIPIRRDTKCFGRHS
jgi:hypothetical protein